MAPQRYSSAVIHSSDVDAIYAQALLTAEWPSALEKHAKTCIKLGIGQTGECMHLKLEEDVAGLEFNLRSGPQPGLHYEVFAEVWPACVLSSFVQMAIWSLMQLGSRRI